MSIKELTKDKPKYFNVVDPVKFVTDYFKGDINSSLIEERITYSRTEKRQKITYNGKEIRNELIYKA